MVKAAILVDTVQVPRADCNIRTTATVPILLLLACDYWLLYSYQEDYYHHYLSIAAIATVVFCDYL